MACAAPGKFPYWNVTGIGKASGGDRLGVTLLLVLFATSGLPKNKWSGLVFIK